MEIKKLENTLPCPFCGEEDHSFISDIDEGERDSEFVVCLNDKCKAEGGVGHNKEAALKNWNKRFK